MTKGNSIWFRLAWLSLAIIGVAVLLFGFVVALWPPAGDASLRAAGVASIGMGLFGVMITWVAFRRRERWAWFTLWYLPVFWTVHLLGNLPPGQDHVHQIVFIVLSLLSLIISAGDFFPKRSRGPV